VSGVSAAAGLKSGQLNRKKTNEHRTSNIERPTSNKFENIHRQALEIVRKYFLREFWCSSESIRVQSFKLFYMDQNETAGF
jgi:hypothetical protein